MQLTPINPSTGEPLEPIPCTTEEELQTMVRAARGAFGSWSTRPFEERADCCRAASKRIVDRIDEIAEVIHTETGKPKQQAKGETKSGASTVNSAVRDMSAAMAPEERPFDGGLCRTHYLPHGVAAVIAPWNYPSYMALELIFPALLAGNTVLFKPSEYSTRTGMAVAAAFTECLPPGVLQIVLGDGQQGRWLTAAEIDFVAFVGSRATGKAIMKQSSDRLCRLLFELGGKDAMIVAKNANLKKAAKFAVQNSIQNTGQVCVAVERIYVERGIEQAFIEQAVELAQDVAIEAGENGQLVIGPMSNEKQMKIVLDHIEDAKRLGAKVHMGGNRLDRPGLFIEPTVMSGLTREMKIMTEETFGPVVAIQAVDSVEEAVREANNTRYGLTATIWGGDSEALYEHALRLEAGLVGINGRQGGNPGIPRAGAKESGFGFLGGVGGMRQFLQPRTVTVR